jgi:iron(III) transport system permease protein
MLRMWTDGKLEQVCVIGLIMMLLIVVFRWVQHALLNRRISGLA